MAWVRDTDERAKRRGLDVVRLVAASVGFAVAGMWAQTQSSVDLNLFATLNSLGNEFLDVAKVLYALGSIWTVLVLALVLVVARHLRIAAQVALAGAAAWGVALLTNEILGDHLIAAATMHVRVGDGPTFPVANVAVVTAVALALFPFVVRPVRRALWVVVIVVMAAAMYLGAGYPSDVIGALLLGVAVTALIRMVFGSPGGAPTTSEVRDALTDLGFAVHGIAYARESIPGASVMDVDLDDAGVRVAAYGRDERDAMFAARLWHRMMYREPGRPDFATRLQHVEHVGFALVLAERAGVPAARFVRSGVGGAETAILVTTPPAGAALADVPVDRVSDGVLAALWAGVRDLHGAGVSHGNLDLLRVLVGDDGTIAFDDLAACMVTRDPYWLDRDHAAVVVATARVVGNERAIAAAKEALGDDGLAGVIPLVQPAALPTGLTHGEAHLGDALKQLRKDLAAAAGVEDVQTRKIRRLGWTDLGIAVGVLIALFFAIRSLSGVDWSSVQGEFEKATWGWAVFALILYPLVPMSWATALMGSVTATLPLVPTVLTQLACSFVGLITPDGIGGTALQIDYLHKQGVPVASGGSAMALSSGVGGIVQLTLFFGAAAITATTVTRSSSDASGSKTLIAIAVVAAILGVLLSIPKIRHTVVPAVRRALHDLWTVLRNPRKAMMLVGGNLAGNLIYPVLLGLCLLAFHQRLDFAQLVFVQVGAGMLGNVAPVPGGLGVTEAALTGLLTNFGVPAAPALAAVLVFRAITFALPPFLGFFTLRWLRAQGYA